MRAISPVIPQANESEVVVAENHPEYQPLPSLQRQDGVVLTRWLLSDEEREIVSKQGYLYVALITANGKIQPLKLTATVPEEFENYQQVEDDWPTEING